MEILSILCGHEQEYGIKIIGTLILISRCEAPCGFEIEELINLGARRVPKFRAILLAVKLSIVEKLSA